MGIRGEYFYVKIVRGECLDKMDPMGLSDPYVKVHFGDKYLGKTQVHSNTLDPEWNNFNTFRMKLIDVQKKETEYLKMIRTSGRATIDSRTADISDEHVMFRLEAYDFNYFRSHGHLGTVRVPWDYMRKMCTFMPKKLVSSDASFRQRLVSMSGKALSFRGPISSTNSNSNNTPGASKKSGSGGSGGKGKEKETFSGRLMSTKWFASSVSDLDKKRDGDEAEENEEDEDGAGDDGGEEPEEESEEEEVVDVVHDPDVLQDEDDIFKSVYTKIDASATRRKIKHKNVAFSGTGGGTGGGTGTGGAPGSPDSPDVRPLTAENLKSQPIKSPLSAATPLAIEGGAGNSGNSDGLGLPSPPDRRKGLLGQQFYESDSPGVRPKTAESELHIITEGEEGRSDGGSVTKGSKSSRDSKDSKKLVSKKTTSVDGSINDSTSGGRGSGNGPAPMLGGKSSGRNKNKDKDKDQNKENDDEADSDSESDSSVVEDNSMWGVVKNSFAVFGDSVKRVFVPTEADK